MTGYRILSTGATCTINLQNLNECNAIVTVNDVLEGGNSDMPPCYEDFSGYSNNYRHQQQQQQRGHRGLGPGQLFAFRSVFLFYSNLPVPVPVLCFELLIGQN